MGRDPEALLCDTALAFDTRLQRFVHCKKSVLGILADESEQRIAEDALEVFAVAKNGRSTIGLFEDEVVFTVEDALDAEMPDPAKFLACISDQNFRCEIHRRIAFGLDRDAKTTACFQFARQMLYERVPVRVRLGLGKFAPDCNGRRLDLDLCVDRGPKDQSQSIGGDKSGRGDGGGFGEDRHDLGPIDCEPECSALLRLNPECNIRIV